MYIWLYTPTYIHVFHSVYLENCEFTLVTPISINAAVPILIFSLSIFAFSFSDSEESGSHYSDPTPLWSTTLLLPLQPPLLYGCPPLPTGAPTPCPGLPSSAPCPPYPAQASTYHTRPLPTSLGGHHPPHPTQTSLISGWPFPQVDALSPCVWLQIHAQGHCFHSAWCLTASKRPPSIPP